MANFNCGYGGEMQRQGDPSFWSYFQYLESKMDQILYRLNSQNNQMYPSMGSNYPMPPPPQFQAIPNNPSFVGMVQNETFGHQFYNGPPVYAYNNGENQRASWDHYYTMAPSGFCETSTVLAGSIPALQPLAPLIVTSDLTSDFQNSDGELRPQLPPDLLSVIPQPVVSHILSEVNPQQTAEPVVTSESINLTSHTSPVKTPSSMQTTSTPICTTPQRYMRFSNSRRDVLESPLSTKSVLPQAPIDFPDATKVSPDHLVDASCQTVLAFTSQNSSTSKGPLGENSPMNSSDKAPIAWYMEKGIDSSGIVRLLRPIKSTEKKDKDINLSLLVTEPDLIFRNKMRFVAAPTIEPSRAPRSNDSGLVHEESASRVVNVDENEVCDAHLNEVTSVARADKPLDKLQRENDEESKDSAEVKETVLPNESVGEKMACEHVMEQMESEETSENESETDKEVCNRETNLVISAGMDIILNEEGAEGMTTLSSAKDEEGNIKEFVLKTVKGAEGGESFPVWATKNAAYVTEEHSEDETGRFAIPKPTDGKFGDVEHIKRTWSCSSTEVSEEDVMGLFKRAHILDMKIREKRGFRKNISLRCHGFYIQLCRAYTDSKKGLVSLWPMLWSLQRTRDVEKFRLATDIIGASEQKFEFVLSMGNPEKHSCCVDGKTCSYWYPPIKRK